MLMRSKCGHFAAKSYADTHAGLCRKCHSNFSFLAEIEGKYGEDALVEYWYAMILSSLSSDKEVDCLIDHLIKFYQKKLNEVPSKQKYIQKMLYMLHSIQKPFDVETLR
jgi:hypothetical protein